MTALRKLILGETRVLPAGVFTIVALALALDEAAGDWWESAGAFLILVSVLSLLAAALR
jgi:hypothetical protein